MEYTSPLGYVIRRHDLSFHMDTDDTQMYTALTRGCEDELALTRFRIESCISEIDK